MYNLRIVYDILDDDIFFHFVIFFNNKEDANFFKTNYELSIKQTDYINSWQQKPYISTTSDGKWLKEYAENRTLKNVTQDMCLSVIEMIKNDANLLEKRKFTNNWIDNDYFLCERIPIGLPDQDELEFYQICVIDKEEYKINKNNYYENFNKNKLILNEDEYDNIRNKTPRICIEIIEFLEDLNGDYFKQYLLISNIDKKIFNLDHFVGIKLYRKTPYDKANEK